MIPPRESVSVPVLDLDGECQILENVKALAQLVHIIKQYPQGSVKLVTQAVNLVLGWLPTIA